LHKNKPSKLEGLFFVCKKGGDATLSTDDDPHLWESKIEYVGKESSQADSRLIITKLAVADLKYT
jgi:hypothetical protein